MASDTHRNRALKGLVGVMAGLIDNMDQWWSRALNTNSVGAVTGGTGILEYALAYRCVAVDLRHLDRNNCVTFNRFHLRDFLCGAGSKNEVCSDGCHGARADHDVFFVHGLVLTL
jgi:hypothetical protein